MQDSSFNPHPSEDFLEEYVFHRLNDAETASVEEHLLICEVCQHTLQSLDEYIVLMKQATAERLMRPQLVLKASAGPRRPRSGWFRAWVLLAGTIITCATLAVLHDQRAGLPAAPNAVELRSFRGGEEMAHARAGQPLELGIDVSDLPTFYLYRLEVVDAIGRQVWSGSAAALSSNVRVHVAKALKRGIYWIRLSSGSGELLREFGLRTD